MQPLLPVALSLRYARGIKAPALESIFAAMPQLNYERHTEWFCRAAGGEKPPKSEGGGSERTANGGKKKQTANT